MARSMFLAVNLTRVTSTWDFLHPDVTNSLDLFLKMGGPVFLRIPASHLLAMLFVTHLSIPLHPLWLALTIHHCPIPREFEPIVSPR